MRVESFADIQDEFIRRVHGVVWCNMATIDAQNRPRSRVLHPIWEASTGWILTFRNTPKARHLAHSSYVSLAYITDLAKPVYVDCQAGWVDDLAQKQRIWDWFKREPAPLGYDPTGFFGRADSPDLGLLQLTPWRIQLFEPGNNRVWYA